MVGAALDKNAKSQSFIPTSKLLDPDRDDPLLNQQNNSLMEKKTYK